MKKIIGTILFCFPLWTFASTQKISLILDWFINPDHAPLFVAEHYDFFKKNGLNVKLIQPSNPSDGPKLVAIGKADIALTYQPQTVIEIKKGLPLVQFGTLVNQPLECISVLASSKIHSIKDLKGKTIGYSDGAVDHQMLKVILNHQGLTLKDVKLISIKYNLVQALMTGRVNAVTGLMRNVEPIEMKLAGKPSRNFFPEDNGFPNYSELIFVTNKKYYKTHKLILDKFTQSLSQAIKYLKKHPRKTWQAFAKTYPQLNNKFNHLSWKQTIKYFNSQSSHVSSQQLSALNKLF